MALKTAYLALSVLGAIFPLSRFVIFLQQFGPDPAAFIQQLFGTPISAFFGWDVIISAVVLMMFVLREGTRLGVRPLWAPIAGTLLVGVSFGLPLFLALREDRLAVSVEPRPSPG
jgi:hypothetical protein